MAKRVKMRHPKLSEQRSKQGNKVDVTAEVREDQVAIHEQSGWVVIKDAKQPAAKQEAYSS